MNRYGVGDGGRVGVFDLGGLGFFDLGRLGLLTQVCGDFSTWNSAASDFLNQRGDKRLTGGGLKAHGHAKQKGKHRSIGDQFSEAGTVEGGRLLGGLGHGLLLRRGGDTRLEIRAELDFGSGIRR